MITFFKTFIFGLVIFGSLNAVADDDHIYVGLGFSTGSGSEEYESENITTDYDIDQNQTDIIVGYQFPSEKRIEFSLTTIDLDVGSENIESEYSGFDVDWHFPFKLQHNMVQPYLGVGFGLYEYEDTARLFEKGENLDGIAINLMAGLFIPVNAQIELDIAFKNKTITWQTVEMNTRKIDTRSSLSSLVLAVRFKF